METPPLHPFATLSPECVLDALDSVGLFSDGRLLALNSYENRVYQIGMEEGPPVVAKFYRPARWSDAAILEEHSFVDELVEREIPVVPALRLNGSTLHAFGGFRFAVFRARAGARPSWTTRQRWSGAGASSAASMRSARWAAIASAPR